MLVIIVRKMHDFTDNRPNDRQ